MCIYIHIYMYMYVNIYTHQARIRDKAKASKGPEDRGSEPRWQSGLTKILENQCPSVLTVESYCVDNF